MGFGIRFFVINGEVLLSGLKFKVKYFQILFDQPTLSFLPLERKETKDQAWIAESDGEF